MIRHISLLAAVTLLCTVPATAQQMPNWQASPEFDRATAPVQPRAASSNRIVTTRHAITLGGHGLRYRAIVAETPLNGTDGSPAAVAVTYGYVVDEPSGSAPRPVLFVFGGGPGAASSALHLEAFGPRRFVGRGSAQRLEDNPHTLLDAADLVFVDPVGTGASMPIAGKDASGFWSVGGDARSVIELIDAWKAANGRERSPTIVLGESYGTARALAMLNEEMKAKHPLPDGIVLLSLAIGLGDLPVLRDALTLPTYSAVAWYHQAIEREGRSVQQQFDLARRFADGTYVGATLAGSAMAEPERRQVAEQTSRLIGLPADGVEAAGLSLDKYTFMLDLLASRGLRTGQLDARVTRPIAASNFHPPYDDPSMSLGAEHAAATGRYLREELGYATPSAYRSLNLAINFKWNWGADYGGSYAGAVFAPYLAAAMKAKPTLQLFTAGGYFDLTTPVLAGVFALDQARVSVERRTTRFYAAGHSIFEDEAGLASLSADLHRFLAGVVAKAPAGG